MTSFPFDNEPEPKEAKAGVEQGIMEADTTVTAAEQDTTEEKASAPSGVTELSLFPEIKQTGKKTKKPEEKLPANGIRFVRLYGNTIVIEDKSFSLDDIRKQIAKTYPEFMDKSKVEMDYDPKTGIIVPIRKAGKKGASQELVGHFHSFEDMFAAPRAVNIIKGKEGIFEVRKTEAGFLSVPLDDRMDTDKLGFIPIVPKIPVALFGNVLHIFRIHMPKEHLVQIFWDKTEKKHFIYQPSQIASRSNVWIKRDAEKQRDKNLVLMIEIHSHPAGHPHFSREDDEDEVATGVYGVMSNIETFPTFLVRISCGGKFLHIFPRCIFDYPSVCTAKF